MTRAALLDDGLTGASIERRIRGGLLLPIRRGVYLVAGAANEVTPVFRATLAIPGSALSHTTAAALHEFAVTTDPAFVHVVVENSRHHRLEGWWSISLGPSPVTTRSSSIACR